MPYQPAPWAAPIAPGLGTRLGQWFSTRVIWAIPGQGGCSRHLRGGRDAAEGPTAQRLAPCSTK